MDEEQIAVPSNEILDAITQISPEEPLTNHPSPVTVPPVDSSPTLTPTSSSLPPIPVPTPTSPPPVTSHQSPITATFDVALLTNEQLKAAAALYTKRNQAKISRKGVAKRKENMELNLREITDFLSRNNGSPLPRIAKNTNITPGTTSKYLRQLIANDKVKADGWGKTRRYYLK